MPVISIPWKTVFLAIGVGITISILIFFAEALHPGYRVSFNNVVLYLVLGMIFSLLGHYAIEKANSPSAIVIYALICAVEDYFVIMHSQPMNLAFHEGTIFFIGQQMNTLRYALQDDFRLHIGVKGKKKRQFTGFVGEVVEE